MNTVSKIVRAVIVCAVAFITVSCSVKEDRQPCPSWIQLFLDSCANVTSSINISLWNEQKVFGERIAIADYPDYYERDVPKGHYTLSCVAGIHRSVMDNLSVMIPHGEDSDSLFVYSNSLSCTEEFTRDTVSLLKKHTCVTLLLNTPEDDPHTYQYHVFSKVSGMNLVDFSPIYGDFEIVRKAKNDTVRFCLPRQNGNHPEDLYILVEKEDGTPFLKIELGEMIQKAGYNWDTRNLNDIQLEIDYVQFEISIVIPDWDAGYKVEFEF